MDYLKQPFLFKIKKVLRYVRLYGPMRTYMKILGQKHLRSHFTVLPRQRGHQSHQQTVGIIGCGNYSFSTIAFFLRREFGDIIAACMDSDINRAASMASQYRIPYYTENADEVFENKNINLIYIASNHATHAEYAIKALEYGKDVYVEKPHVVSMDQLHRLHNAMRSNDGKVFLGFNRPGSRFGKIIAETLFREKAAAVYSWFIIGHFLGLDHWYLREGEGGRVLGNLCHWTDHILGLVREKKFPLTIIPTRAEQNDRDMIVSFIFGDGTIASLNFTSQGQTFEGVRESFRAQKGDIIIAMDDFKKMSIEIGQYRKKYANYYRDHGHENNIIGAYRNVNNNLTYFREEEISQILNSAWLFLNTKEAVDKNAPLIINSFEDEFAGIYPLNPRHEVSEQDHEKVTTVRY